MIIVIGTMKNSIQVITFLLDERDKAEETAKIIRETYNKRFKHGEERKLFG